jgi:hypothetical protein
MKLVVGLMVFSIISSLSGFILDNVIANGY